MNAPTSFTAPDAEKFPEAAKLNALYKQYRNTPKDDPKHEKLYWEMLEIATGLNRYLVYGFKKTTGNLRSADENMFDDALQRVLKYLLENSDGKDTDNFDGLLHGCLRNALIVTARGIYHRRQRETIAARSQNYWREHRRTPESVNEDGLDVNQRLMLEEMENDKELKTGMQRAVQQIRHFSPRDILIFRDMIEAQLQGKKSVEAFSELAEGYLISPNAIKTIYYRVQKAVMDCKGLKDALYDYPPKTQTEFMIAVLNRSAMEAIRREMDSHGLRQ